MESSTQKVYVLDFICRGCEFVELNWIGGADYYIGEVLSLEIKNEIISLYLEVYYSEFAHIDFKAKSCEWSPITVSTLDELDNIKDTPYYEIVE